MNAKCYFNSNNCKYNEEHINPSIYICNSFTEIGNCDKQSETNIRERLLEYIELENQGLLIRLKFKLNENIFVVINIKDVDLDEKFWRKNIFKSINSSEYIVKETKYSITEHGILAFNCFKTKEDAENHIKTLNNNLTL